MKGIVDKGLCISCGFCPDVCPEIFMFDEDGKAVAKNIEISDELLDDARGAEGGCPTSAIKVS